MNNYNINLICTYKTVDSLAQNGLYQKELLEAFNMDLLDEETNINKLTKEISNLYTNLRNIEEFKLIYKSLKENIIFLNGIDDDEYCFMFLFGFETFDIFHECLVNFIKKSKILEVDINNIIQQINSI